MNTSINEAFARLTMLEFAVEVILANYLASMPKENSEKFKKDFVDRFDRPALPSGQTSPDQEQLEAFIAERARQLAERLMTKVSERETDICDKQ